MNLRKGDIVSVLATVQYQADASDDWVHLRVHGEHSSLMISRSATVLTIVTPVFEVGETVWWKMTEGIMSGDILAISNGHAWIDLYNGDYCTRLLSSIQRKEDDV